MNQEFLRKKEVKEGLDKFLRKKRAFHSWEKKSQRQGERSTLGTNAGDWISTQGKERLSLSGKKNLKGKPTSA